MMSKKLYSLAVVCALAFAGCGDKSDDVTKVMKASQGTASLVVKQAAAQVRAMEKQTRAVASAYQNQMIFGQKSLINACSGVSFQVDDASCTGDCPTATSFKADCTWANSSKTCGGETFTFKDGTFGLTMSWPADYSSFTLAMNMAANVVGGDLDGKVECNFNMTFTQTSAQNGDSISCDNFSCKYDGSEIDCEDIKEEFGTSC